MRWARQAEWVADVTAVRGLRNRWAGVRDETGGVTAEFAVVVPVVLVVLGLVIGGVALSAHRITLVSAAADIARLEARGESAEPRLANLGAGVGIERERADGLLCVSLRATPVGGLLAAVGVSAQSCAAISDTAVSETAVSAASP